MLILLALILSACTKHNSLSVHHPVKGGNLNIGLVRVNSTDPALATSVSEKVLAGFKKVITEQGAEKIAALASPSATTEELYLLQKLLRGIGCPNIDHRLRQTDLDRTRS